MRKIIIITEKERESFDEMGKLKKKKEKDKYLYVHKEAKSMCQKPRTCGQVFVLRQCGHRRQAIQTFFFFFTIYKYNFYSKFKTSGFLK